MSHRGNCNVASGRSLTSTRYVPVSRSREEFVFHLISDDVECRTILYLFSIVKQIDVCRKAIAVHIHSGRMMIMKRDIV